MKMKLIMESGVMKNLNRATGGGSGTNGIPLALKCGFTAFMAVLVPVY